MEIHTCTHFQSEYLCNLFKLNFEMLSSVWPIIQLQLVHVAYETLTDWGSLFSDMPIIISIEYPQKYR